MSKKEVKRVGLFVILSLFLLVIIAFFVVSYTHVYDEPIPWPGHGGDEILVEIRNSEMTLQEALNNNDIGTWVNHGSYISYDGGDVGIGIIPEEKFHIDGNIKAEGRIKAEGFCVGEDCYDMMPMDHAYKPIPSCTEDEVVKWNGTDWECLEVKSIGFCHIFHNFYSAKYQNVRTGRLDDKIPPNEDGYEGPGSCFSTAPGICDDGVGCRCKQGYSRVLLGLDTIEKTHVSISAPFENDLDPDPDPISIGQTSNHYILSESYACIKE